MAEFTFLELHLDDATITNNAPYSGVDETEADDEGTGVSSLIIPLVFGVVLVLAALAVKKMKAGGDDPGGLV